MNKNIKVQAQGGFTLIELIVVIVILGILAATALPKFANLSGDARYASLNAAKGALSSAAAIAHGKILVNPDAAKTGTLLLEGSSIAIANGYPDGSATGIILAAGLDTVKDYNMVSTGTGVPTGGFLLVPSGATNQDKCYVSYTPATKDATTGAITAPIITLASTANADACQ